MPKSQQIKKVLARFLRLLPYIILVIVSIPILGMWSTETTKVMGLRTIPVPVAGTGSMYPSLFWSTSEGGPEDEGKILVEEYRTTPHLYRRYGGYTIFGRTFFRRSVGHGDMVAFKNDKTVDILKSEGKDTSAGFIKRIIGVAGDVIELRDGFVYRSGELLSEPYIDSPRSTYGGTGLADCEKLIIPPGSYFVLGDNRKVSSDSRFELGLIEEKDIEYVLPYTEQNIYHSLWRDTAKDSELLGLPSLSLEEFVSLVNKERSSKNIPKLSVKSALTKSSTLRGEHLLADEQTSYNMEQATSNVGYTNVILGEFVSRGHFTASELLTNLLYHAGTAKQIVNSNFSDLGVSAVVKEIDGCPTQIIVGHLGGYVPPDYDANEIQSWIELRDNLRSILPSWEKAVEYKTIEQDKLSALLTILRRRISLTEEIVLTMEKNEWLSVSQRDRIKNDNVDADNLQRLSKELNKE